MDCSRFCVEMRPLRKGSSGLHAGRTLEIGCPSALNERDRVEDGRQLHARLQGPDHDPVDLVVNDIPDLPKIYRVDNLVPSLSILAVEISRLTTMPYAGLAMNCGEEQRTTLPE